VPSQVTPSHAGRKGEREYDLVGRIPDRRAEVAKLAVEVAFLSPMRLKEYAIDLLEVDGLGSVAHGLDEGGYGEISSATKDSVARTSDEAKGVVGEGVVTEGDAVKLVENELDDVVRGEFVEDNGVGDATTEVVVDGERKLLKEFGLSEENEIVVFGKVLKNEPEFAKGVDLHEVGVINDGSEHFASLIDFVGFFNKPGFALEVSAVGRNAESLAENAQDRMVGVERTVDDGSEKGLRVVFAEGALDDAFSGARFTHDDAKAALLAMDTQGGQDFVLSGEKRDVLVGEGVLIEAKVGSDHD
jgi:hypothetical protein